MRRAAHEGFNIRAAAKYQPLQEKESALLALRCLQDPDNWDDHLKHSAASSVLCAVYGWLSADKSADPFIDRIYQFMDRLTHAALPGSYLVEIFPSMLYLPDWMAKWKREGCRWFRKDTQVFEGLLADVQNNMVSQSCPCRRASHALPESRHRRTLFCSRTFGRREEVWSEHARNGMVIRYNAVSRWQSHIDIRG